MLTNAHAHQSIVSQTSLLARQWVVLTHWKPTMPTIKIDNQDYELNQLSDEAKAQLAAMQFCDQELARLQAQAAAYQTARMAYAKALQAALPTPLEKAKANETLQFNWQPYPCSPAGQSSERQTLEASWTLVSSYVKTVILTGC